jgi:hypothetical protein
MANNKTSFDMNLMIRQWREKLAQSTTVSRESLDELESHLRDSATELEQRGLSAEEAYMVAARRIGPSGALEIEFEKAMPPPRRMVIGRHYLGVSLVLLVLLLVFMTIYPLTPRGLDASVPQSPPPGTFQTR